MSFAAVLFILVLVDAGKFLAAGGHSCSSCFPRFARFTNELPTRVPKRTYGLLWEFYAFLCTFYGVSMAFLYRKWAAFALSHAVFSRIIERTWPQIFFSLPTRSNSPPIAIFRKEQPAKGCIPQISR